MELISVDNFLLFEIHNIYVDKGKFLDLDDSNFSLSC